MTKTVKLREEHTSFCGSLKCLLNASIKANDFGIGRGLLEVGVFTEKFLHGDVSSRWNFLEKRVGREERNEPMKISSGIGQLVKSGFRRSGSVQLADSIKIFERRSSKLGLLLEGAFRGHFIE